MEGRDWGQCIVECWGRRCFAGGQSDRRVLLSLDSGILYLCEKVWTGFEDLHLFCVERTGDDLLQPVTVSTTEECICPSVSGRAYKCGSSRL